MTASFQTKLTVAFGLFLAAGVIMLAFAVHDDALAKNKAGIRIHHKWPASGKNVPLPVARPKIGRLFVPILRSETFETDPKKLADQADQLMADFLMHTPNVVFVRVEHNHKECPDPTICLEGPLLIYQIRED